MARKISTMKNFDRELVVAVCAAMRKVEPSTLKFKHHTHSSHLNLSDGTTIAALHGHNGRGGTGHIPISSAYSIINQVAGGKKDAYEFGKFLLHSQEFQRTRRLATA